MMQSYNKNDRKNLEKMLMTYSFAVNEAVLYLDTHPTNQKALRFYEKYVALYQNTRDEYESKYGPTTPFSGSKGDKWQWVTEPFPWEK